MRNNKRNTMHRRHARARFYINSRRIAKAHRRLMQREF